MEGFYKYEDGEWLHAQFSVHFPDGTILSVDNKIEKDGWVWMDSPPNGFEDSENFVNS